MIVATCAGFEPAIFSVTGRYAKPLHQQAFNRIPALNMHPCRLDRGHDKPLHHGRRQNSHRWTGLHPVKVYQGRFIAVKLKLNMVEFSFG